MESVPKPPGWVGGLASLLLLAAAGIIGNRADAALVRALPLLSEPVTLFGGDLVLIVVIAFVVGKIALDQFEKAKSWYAAPNSGSAVSDPSQQRPETPELTPRQKACADLDLLLEELSVANTSNLPNVLTRLRYVFDRLGRSEDSEWCQAELNGFREGEAPDYRNVDVTVKWRPVGGVASMHIPTGRVIGEPPERVERLLVGFPVAELVQFGHAGWKEASGNVRPGLTQGWREVAEISRQEIQRLLRRISDEAYRRALAAKSNERPNAESA
jgi:hypothetical protein